MTIGATIPNITDADFAKVTGQDGLVLVDFYATWCGPCKRTLTGLETIIDSVPAKIVKMDVDENPDTTLLVGIMSIPTLVLFKDGRLVDRLVGYHTPEQIKDFINENL